MCGHCVDNVDSYIVVSDSVGAGRVGSGDDVLRLGERCNEGGVMSKGIKAVAVG